MKQGIHDDALRFVLADEWHQLANSSDEVDAHNAAIIESFAFEDHDSRRGLEAGLAAVKGIATFGKGTALFATRGPAVAMGLVPAETYGSAIARAVSDGGIAGTISANATPIAFVVGEGLDFTIGVDPAPWGAEPAPAWSMEGANNLDMLPGLLDSPTFGTASPIAGVVDIFTEHIPAINESAQELGDVWSQFGAVPAA